MTDPVEHGDLSSDHVAGAGPLWLTAAALERSRLIDRVDAMLESVELPAESVDAFRGSQTESPDLISDDVAETRRLLGDGFETANLRVVDVLEERETPAGEEHASSHAHRSEAHSRGSRDDPRPQVSVIELGFHLQTTFFIWVTLSSLTSELAWIGYLTPHRGMRTMRSTHRTTSFSTTVGGSLPSR